ncbi:MAG: hemerythrin domain-containing protein [Burkholderiales bacterium]|nr:hemerythrin domain-containing protein [Burkholderiales bacterium]
MSTLHSLEPAAAGLDAGAPLADFSRCHDEFVTLLDIFLGLPGMVATAARARARASDVLKMFRHGLLAHHDDEERELFPAVLVAALPGEEARRARDMVEQLVREHREIALLWKRLEPSVESVARGYLPELDGALLNELVQQFNAHVRLEEEDFLPFAQQVLGRQGDDMAALGMALHRRHEDAQTWATAVIYGAS